MVEALYSVRYKSAEDVSEESLEATGFAMFEALRGDERLAARGIGPVLSFDYENSAFELMFGGEITGQADGLVLLADAQAVLNRRLAELGREDEPPLALERSGELARH